MGRPLRVLYGLDPMAPKTHIIISTLKCQLSPPPPHPQGAAWLSVGVWVKEMADTSDWNISCYFHVFLADLCAVNHLAMDENGVI